jgi:hypothetical protein
MVRLGCPEASTILVSVLGESSRQTSALCARENPLGPSIDRYGNVKSAGITPTMVRGVAPTRGSGFPTTAMSPPNRRCQYEWLSTTLFSSPS